MLSNNNDLPTLYQQFIHKTRYAKWIESENRRESWTETVNRYTDFMYNHLSKNHDYESSALAEEINEAIRNLEIMPSMRALMTSGPALERDHIAGFNCSYMPMNHTRCFDEMVYILMCGAGVGFSVERQEVNQLPEIPSNFYAFSSPYTVEDSKMGWAKAVRFHIENLYGGIEHPIDTSKLRPAGARLKTFGGRASGPEPLERLIKFLTETFQKAAGRKLTSIEVHDICCVIGDVVVSGGVRRSALISLSNLSDERMREAKSGQWWEHTPYRRLANNSVAYTEKPDVGRWMHEWSSIYDSKSGERGIFNRQAVYDQCERYNRRTQLLGSTSKIAFGVNPCGEIILRPFQFCNLTEVIARKDDTIDTLMKKVRLATILGTYQSTLTNFKYIRDIWRKNCEEERLLGVSITGIMDCDLLNGVGTSTKSRNELLNKLRIIVQKTNIEWAAYFGIEPSAAMCCVKPSGTVSQLTDSSSGIHRRYASQYIRSARNDVKDPITQFLIEQGIPHEPDMFNKENMVFSFPIIAPKNCVTRNDGTAIQELENWLDFKTYWCHHNPSVTINVREHEWPEVGAWVYNNFDDVAGISFLPHDDHSYKQAPYQDASIDKVLAMSKTLPNSIDWSLFIEKEDMTTGTQELACSSGTCEI